MTIVSEMRVLPALELEFPAGLPGLGEVHRLRLEPLGISPNVFGRLVADHEIEVAGHRVDGLNMVVAAPGLLWPDYVVEVDDETVALLELGGAEDAAALVVVNVGERFEDCTANLFAPIVLNVRSGRAAQVVPRRSEHELGWPLAAPLPVFVAA